MTDALLKILSCYLLGSLLGGLIVGKLRGGVDIRTQGSGNAGGTNALRTQGKWFALWVMVIDVGKGWMATAILPTLRLFSSSDTALSHSIIQWTTVLCATAVVLGHVFPIWFQFRGGKGAATLIGVVLGIQPITALLVLGVWLLVLVMTGFVGLSTILATTAFTIYQLIKNPTDAVTYFGIAMTAFVIFTHRANISRMRSGTENRAKKLWLLRPR